MMATKTVINFKKILVGISLCAVAGMGQFILSGSSPARVDETHGSSDTSVTLTKTVRLTQTPAPRFTLTTTVILPTYEWMRATEEILFPWCGPDNRRLYSDSGDWVATRCINNSLGVYNLNDLKDKFYFTYLDVYGNENQDGNGSGLLRPIHFSKSEGYFYFSPSQSWDGCPMYEINYALYKLDLKTGGISNQVSPEDKVGFNFAFSEDDKYLAYIASNLKSPSLYIQDLKKDTKKIISINGAYSEVGYMVWSPNNDQLVFSARSGEDCFELDYYVVSLDLKNFDQKVIIHGKELTLFPVKWIDDEHILVLRNFNPEYSILNINTGKLEPESHLDAIPND
jgi:hypothetical protein